MKCHDLRLTTDSMVYASAYVAEQPLGLHVSRPPVIPPSISTDGSRAIPSLERINIMLTHLIFGGETFTELIEYQIGIDWRDAADQSDNIHLMISRLRSCPPPRTKMTA